MRRAAPALVAALAAVCAPAGCGRAEAPPQEPTELEARGSTPAAEAPRPIDPARTGAVAGLAAFAGEPPERRAVPLIRECGVHGNELLAEDVVVGADGGLRDVLVRVRRGLAGWAVPPASGGPGPVLDQAGCRYAPHVIALRAGETLSVSNSDPLTHNVNVRAPRNGLDSNSSQGQGAAPLELPFARAELGVRVACDLHPWMGAVVHVLDHPFYAVTGDDGRFRIEGLPEGEYELEALHPVLGKRSATVTVQAGAEAAARFEFADAR